MKTILIPTDYQPASLDCIHAVCGHLKNEELNLIFIHVFKLSDSITDLLMLSKRSREYEKVSDEFYERCNLLRMQYPRIKNVRIEFLYGSTLSMFKNFLENNEVDGVVYTEGCTYEQIHRSSIDPSVLVKKCGLPVISANTKTYARVRQPELAAVYQEELLTEV
ncbi:hypothetical protein [Mucilaginibacter sp.]|jgi:hypothetical protein|uniref:hypothetical protein n=1 Tax=Mucilaginibacter sp. TaxID=1882438 RepID=UPI00356628A9